MTALANKLAWLISPLHGSSPVVLQLSPGTVNEPYGERFAVISKASCLKSTPSKLSDDQSQRG
jgi:hypothetical protein